MRNPGCLAAALFMIAVGCSEGSKAGPHDLRFPETGVVCDPAAGFCSDRQGISLGLSEVHLGKTAAYKAFIATHFLDDYKSPQPQNYRFSDGTLCDHVELWCGNAQTGEANEKVSAALFA